MNANLWIYPLTRLTLGDMSTDGATLQAKNQLIELLAKMTQGERLPGERSLADEFGVCRMTLRRAIEDLILDGKLERRARSGTYVRRPIISSEMRLKSFTEEIRQRGQAPSTLVVSMKKIKTTKTIARALRVRQNEEIFSITRLRLADNLPVALETLKIAGHAAPGLTVEDVERSLYDALVSKYGIRIMHAKASISAVNPSEKERNLLQVNVKTPCLLIKMLDSDQSGRPIMVAECIYRSDLYEVNIDVTANVNSITSRRIS